MAKAHQEVISMLGQLLEVCESCEGAYMKAGERELSENAQKLYRQHSAQMVRCIAELKAEMAKLGENLNLLKRDAEEKVAENPLTLGIEAQEKEALMLYHEALRMELPGNIPSILRRHVEILKRSPASNLRSV